MSYVSAEKLTRDMLLHRLYYFAFSLALFHPNPCMAGYTTVAASAAPGVLWLSCVKLIFVEKEGRLATADSLYSARDYDSSLNGVHHVLVGSRRFVWHAVDQYSIDDTNWQPRKRRRDRETSDRQIAAWPVTVAENSRLLFHCCCPTFMWSDDRNSLQFSLLFDLQTHVCTWAHLACYRAPANFAKLAPGVGQCSQFCAACIVRHDVSA